MKNKIPRILVIAGSDSGAGAGIQADIKSIAANGAYATTAITAITAQNTLGVQAIMDIPAQMIRAQIISVLDDIGADIIKTGMLSNKATIELVSDIIDEYKIRLVLDPVMVAKGGAKLIKDSAIKNLKTKLIPKAYLLTPNIPEAEIIAEMKIKNESDMEAAARNIIEKFGCNAVLLKGGHMKGRELVDILVYKNGKKINIKKFRSQRIRTKNTHGTGCTYASTIAANLAKGERLEIAVKKARYYLWESIQASRTSTLGQGHSPLNHFA
jgi:hydroxymethylpyrimidine kinase/phosphomethylpyrimidine kinase